MNIDLNLRNIKKRGTWKRASIWETNNVYHTATPRTHLVILNVIYLLCVWVMFLFSTDHFIYWPFEGSNSILSFTHSAELFIYASILQWFVNMLNHITSLWIFANWWNLFLFEALLHCFLQYHQRFLSHWIRLTSGMSRGRTGHFQGLSKSSVWESPQISLPRLSKLLRYLLIGIYASVLYSSNRCRTASVGFLYSSVIIEHAYSVTQTCVCTCLIQVYFEMRCHRSLPWYICLSWVG
jgi:hypothetical protein